MKNLKILFKTFFLFNCLLGIDIIEFPQNAFSLGKWNGGTASSNIYQQTNPAALPFKDYISFSIINMPEDISSQSILISQNINNYLIKFNSFILNYGDLEDYVTQNQFSAKDLQVGLSIKSTVKEILSFGFQVYYLNRKIENYTDNLLIAKIGLRTQLFEERMGLGLVFNKSLISNFEEYGTYVILGSFYRPIYFPGEFSFDLIKSQDIDLIFSMLLNVNNYLDFTFGITDDKLDFHTSSTFENIYAGLSLGFHLNLEKYNIGFGLRNIGQFGTMSGINLGYSF